MRLLEELFTRIVNLFAVIAGLLLIAVMVATVVKVGMRAGLGVGIIGIDQLSGTAMVYMTFLGAVWVLRQDGHVTVDLVLITARPAFRRKLVLINSLIGAAVCFTVAYFGALTVQTSIERGIMVVQAIEIPRAIGLIPIPVGAFVLGIEFLRRALAAARGADANDNNEPALGA